MRRGVFVDEAETLGEFLARAERVWRAVLEHRLARVAARRRWQERQIERDQKRLAALAELDAERRAVREARRRARQAVPLEQRSARLVNALAARARWDAKGRRRDVDSSLVVPFRDALTAALFGSAEVRHEQAL